MAYLSLVIPYLGTPGAPFFDGQNNTHFLDLYDQLYSDYRRSESEKNLGLMKKLFTYPLKFFVSTPLFLLLSPPSPGRFFYPPTILHKFEIIRVLTGLLAGRRVLNNDADRVFFKFSIYNLGLEPKGKGGVSCLSFSPIMIIDFGTCSLQPSLYFGFPHPPTQPIPLPHLMELRNVL